MGEGDMGMRERETQSEKYGIKKEVTIKNCYAQ